MATFSHQPSAMTVFQTPKPIIVKLIEPPSDPTGIGLAHVILQAMGFTAVVTLLAVALGVVLAAVMYWVRRRTTDAPPS
jgi:hypothetical protein